MKEVLTNQKIKADLKNDMKGDVLMIVYALCIMLFMVIPIAVLGSFLRPAVFFIWFLFVFLLLIEVVLLFIVIHMVWTVSRKRKAMESWDICVESTTYTTDSYKGASFVFFETYVKRRRFDTYRCFSNGAAMRMFREKGEFQTGDSFYVVSYAFRPKDVVCAYKTVQCVYENENRK